MPVIVSPEDYGLWLGPTSGRAGLLEQILRPAAADVLETYAVTPRVNSPANDDEGCVEPI
jgi:putative SOS response-associated peptidase YedK